MNMSALKLSFKVKTILGVALIEVFFLLILVINSRNILYKTVDKDIKTHAQSISLLLASALTDAVISKDLATIQSILETGMAIEQLFYIRVLNAEKTIAKIGERSYLQKEFKMDSNLSDANSDGSFDVYSDIKVDGYSFGKVEIGLSIAEKYRLISDATNHLSVIAIVELIFVALFSLLLGIALTRRLIELQQTALSITEENMGLQIPIIGNDEIADTCRAFNFMSAKIQSINFKLVSDNARMDAIMNTATDGIFMINLDGTIESVNKSACNIFGLNDKDMLGKNLLSLIPGLHFWDADNSQFQQLQYAEGVSNTGVSIPLEIYASKMFYEKENYVVGVIRDLTALNRLQDELSAIFNLSPDGFLILSGEGVISYTNSSLHKMVMLDDDVILMGKNWSFFQHEIFKRLDNEHHHNLDFLDETLTDNTLYLKYPLQRILRCYRRKINEQNVNSAEILFFHDITQNTIMDNMKSEFLTTAAHELRTPLAGVMGFSELLSMREYPPEKTKELAKTINRQSIRLKLLLDDLLDLASIENGTFSATDLRRGTLEIPILECCHDFDGSDDFHHLVIEPTEYWPLVEVNQLKIRQIITNVLSNAYKYSPENPEITVSTLTQVENGIAEFGITIQDHGIGMTPKQLSHIGERFYRADMSGNIPGTGLGMALTNELLATQNARIEIQSTFGEGTAMTVWIPISSKNGNS